MGLDMYLYKAHYIGAEYDFNEVKGNINITKQNEPIDINFKKLAYILEEKMYWRKCNAIHKWFVDHVQNGEDNCAFYYVPGYLIKTLVEICKEVLEDHDLACISLPTQEGFFFGSLEYDDWYFQDLQETVEALQDVKDSDSFFYHASW